jgi:hypothetical protein
MVQHDAWDHWGSSILKNVATNTALTASPAGAIAARNRAFPSRAKRARAPTQPDRTLEAAPAKARTMFMGKNGTTFSIPLKATGSTAPAAKRETSCAEPLVPRMSRGLIPTANAAPPT